MVIPDGVCYTKSMRNRHLTPEQREEAVRRYAAGTETVAQIARSLGVSPTTIQYHADRRGQQPRYGYGRAGVFGTLAQLRTVARRVVDTLGQDGDALRELKHVLDSFEMGERE